MLTAGIRARGASSLTKPASKRNGIEPITRLDAAPAQGSRRAGSRSARGFRLGGRFAARGFAVTHGFRLPPSPRLPLSTLRRTAVASAVAVRQKSFRGSDGRVWGRGAPASTGPRPSCIMSVSSRSLFSLRAEVAELADAQASGACCRKVVDFVRKWRNWQTRKPQELVAARSWRFKSSLPHQSSFQARFWAFGRW
jgi:hypothetical protein